MTIWAVVILHVAGHAVRLVDIPADQTLTVASAWIVLQVGALFLVFAFRNNLLAAARMPRRVTPSAASLSPVKAQG